ncbi:DNA polymerase III subunit gamma/tau [Paracoccus sp. (in: a-proteobacteria)]|uniref:DNA polymerase III subunit gamma/tau n=1 Tax=Paracoccus sp. TaxID=267 RepID=UPI002AFF55FB|nr:DNA polymerase III subunit gamma/tau [Paracoccus sp. (in: a-proteobacteria)]
MEKFLVSARKYRPQNFNSVVGQSHITTTLKNAIKNNQLAHAFLFCGPRGVGKTTCARILAKTINCESRTEDGEACNVCQSCISFDKGNSLNIHELDAASNNSVEDIRTLVDQIRFAPQAGKYKVYIIDEVHMLSSQAFNAFLKTLEEPPSFAIFILATTEKHKIIPTILSRCQIFDFKRITNNDTVVHLEEICKTENVNAEKQALHLIAQKSEGCLRDSLSIFDKIVSFTNAEVTYNNTLEHLNILDEDYYFKLTEDMLEQRLSETILTLDEINRKGFEGDAVLNGYAEFLRNLLVSKDKKVAGLLEVAEVFKKKYLELAKKIEGSWLLSALNILADSEINYRQAKNKRLHVELTFIKLCYLNQAIQLTGENGESGKKKRLDGVRPVSFRALTPVADTSKRKTEKSTSVQENKTSTASSISKKISETTYSNKEHSSAQSGATLTIEEPKLKFKAGISLDKIREKVVERNKSFQTKPLEEAEIQQAWKKYVSQLEENKQHSTVSIFKQVQLGIVDENCIDIITEDNFQKQFIEGERAALVSHLQAHFNNRFLTYQITVNQQSKPAAETNSPTLSTPAKYQKIIEMYPLVKELKERLHLNLDY